jgi:hypothetical protein
VTINTLLGNYEHVVQALVAAGTIGSVVVSLYLAIPKKAKIKGELYFATIDSKYGVLRKAKIEEVNEKSTFLLAEIRNTSDLDITLRNNCFEVVNSCFYKKNKNRTIVRLVLSKYEYTRLSDHRDYLVPRRKTTNFKLQNDLKLFCDSEPNFNTTLLGSSSFRVVLEDELGQKFKLKIDKYVISKLNEIATDNNTVEAI